VFTVKANMPASQGCIVEGDVISDQGAVAEQWNRSASIDCARLVIAARPNKDGGYYWAVVATTSKGNSSPVRPNSVKGQNLVEIQ
jgi:hypothetical protein